MAHLARGFLFFQMVSGEMAQPYFPRLKKKKTKIRLLKFGGELKGCQCFEAYILFALQEFIRNFGFTNSWFGILFSISANEVEDSFLSLPH